MRNPASACLALHNPAYAATKALQTRHSRAGRQKPVFPLLRRASLPKGAAFRALKQAFRLCLPRALICREDGGGIIFRSITPVPWKNGGGVTREIARAEGGNGWLWRLSVADVSADGPFSHFPGMTRILTVIEGAGIDLLTPDGAIAARLDRPVAFSGETAVEGRLCAGPIRNLNLIHDAEAATAEVTPVRGPLVLAAGPGPTWVFCRAGPLRAEGRPVPAGGLAQAAAGPIELGPGAAGLLVRISPRP